MRKNEFVRYLTTPKDANDKPFAESTAKEMASLCSSIEKEYGMDLDDALQEPTEKSHLFDFAYSLKRADPKKYHRALWNYSDFFHNAPTLITKGHFKLYPDAVLDGIDDELLMRMEGEYECILGFGRDEFFRKACEERIERIPVLLSPEIKKRTYKPSNEEIAEEIYELFNPNCRNANKKDIVAILEKAKQFTDTVTGEFVKAEQPYIVLYYKAIGGKNKEEKIARLANVLAHEYMHYMEYRYCLAHVVESYQNEKLSEAMADFFAELYTLKNEYYASKERKTVAKRRYDLWLERFGSCWPYAKALHFYTVCGNTMKFSDKYCDYEQHGSVKKLCEVFGNSYDSMAAYNSLLYF